jgi:hypothetical protein
VETHLVKPERPSCLGPMPVNQQVHALQQSLRLTLLRLCHNRGQRHNLWIGYSLIQYVTNAVVPTDDYMLRPLPLPDFHCEGTYVFNGLQGG